MGSIQDDVKKPSREDTRTTGLKSVVNVIQESIAFIFAGPEGRNITN